MPAGDVGGVLHARGGEKRGNAPEKLLGGDGAADGRGPTHDFCFLSVLAMNEYPPGTWVLSTRIYYASDLRIRLIEYKKKAQVRVPGTVVPGY